MSAPYSLDNALYQWEEGERRLRQIGGGDSGSAARAVDAVRDELRRRLGPTYTTAQLVELYSRGTDWCLDAAAVAVPDRAAYLDPQAVADGAFYAHLRGAADWAGGRLVLDDEQDAT